MPAITSLSFAALAPSVRALVAFGRVMVGGAERVLQAFANRRAAQVLARFDDRMLADIGLTRADLRDAYSDTLWSDPTMRLRARALERRLARYGVSNGLMIDPAIAPPLVPKVDAATLAQARGTFCGRS